MQDMGLAFDQWDLDYYYRLFAEDMKRNPTNVELFDIAQVSVLCHAASTLGFSCDAAPCAVAVRALIP